MRALAIFLLLQGATLIGGAIYSGGWNTRQLSTFLYIESTLREPFRILKKEEPEAYSKVSYTEAGVDRTLDFVKRRSQAFGVLEGFAIVIGCVSIIESLVLYRKISQNENRA